MFVDARDIRQWEGETSLSSHERSHGGRAASGSVEDAHPTGADKQAHDGMKSMVGHVRQEGVHSSPSEWSCFTRRSPLEGGSPVFATSSQERAKFGS